MAVGDLHADLPAARSVLRMAKLVDENGRWTGGTATLVQTGDVTDRGPDGRALLAWLRSLEREAAAAGGRFVPLLGNHEVMNLQGDWRYVSPDDLQGYGGVEARAAAFGPTGEDGAWLRARDSVARIGDTVFVHGGVDARWATLGIDGINDAIREAIGARTVVRGASVDAPPAILGPDGPLWNRGYILGDAGPACDELGRALSALHAKRMVVGHTTQKDGRVLERCDGRLFGIDTGISAVYGGHLAALELHGDVVTPRYAP